MKATRRDAKGRVLRKGESYRKKQKLYVYSYTDVFGRRKSVYARELTELRKKEEMLSRDSMDEIDVYIAGQADLNFVFDRYINSKISLRKSTRSNYIYTYDQYVRGLLGKRLIASIKYTDILYFYKELIEEKGLAINTVDSVNVLLNPTFAMAVRDDIIRKNPVTGVMAEIKKNYRSGTKREALTIEEQHAFVEALNQDENAPWRPLFMVMLGSGVRIGEIIGLRWVDVDLEGRTIDINHTTTYIEDRTGNGGSGFVVTEPKTESGKRVIPMLDEVYDALLEEKRMQAMSGVHCTDEIDGYSGFIFCNRFGNIRKMSGTNDALARIVNDYNAREELLARREHRKAVLLPHITNHILRHTFCTRLCEKETNLKVIQYVMGHSDIRTTMDIYAEATKHTAQDSFKKFSNGVNIF